MSKFCSKCGSEVGVEIKYCPKCGAALLPEWEIGVRKEIKYVAGGCGGCLTLILGLIMFVFLFMSSNNIVVFIIATVAATVPCIFYIMAILWLDRHEKEPFYLIAGAFIWGALVSSLFAVIVNTLFKDIATIVSGNPNIGQFLTVVFSAPLFEESSKALALLILFLFMRHEFDNVTDGIIYGSLVGMGFALTENINYFASAMNQAGVLGLGLQFIGRSILFGLGHAMFTGTTGAGLGYARQTHKGLAVKIIVPIVAFMLAIGEHFLWNSVCVAIGAISQNLMFNVFILWPLQSIVLALPVLIALLAIAYFALKQEKAVIKEQLAEELKNGVVLPDEYEALTRGGRFRREWDILWQKGIAPWYYLRKLFQLEVDLAFRKWHSSRGEKLKGYQRVYSEESFRAQIAGIRTKLI